MDEIPNELNRETFEYLINGERVRDLGLSQDPRYCTRDEFTLLMLVDLGIVQEEDLAMCRDKFEKLDVDKSGRITKRDLQLLAARNVVRNVAAKVLYSWLPSGRGKEAVVVEEEEEEDEVVVVAVEGEDEVVVVKGEEEVVVEEDVEVEGELGAVVKGGGDEESEQGLEVGGEEDDNYES